MTTRAKFISLLIGALAGFVLLVPLFSVDAGGHAAGLNSRTTSRVQAAPDATAVIVVSASAFSSDGYYVHDDFFFDFNGGYMRGTDSTHNYGCVKSGVQIPNFVFINSYSATAYDNEAGTKEDAYIALWRVNKDTGKATRVAQLTTTGMSDAIQVLSTTAISGRITQLPGYAYYVTACLPSADIRLYSVRISYDTDVRHYLPEKIYLPSMKKK